MHAMLRGACVRCAASCVGGYIMLAQNIALFALIGYCPRIGVIENEKGGNPCRT